MEKAILNGRDMKLCLAVLIEGEGSLQIARVRKSYQASITIAMVTCEWIALCWDHFKVGNIYQVKTKSKNHKNHYRWVTQKSSEVESTLKAILPFLHEKKDQAKAIIEFIGFQKENSRQGRQNPIEYRLQCEKFFKRIKDLHNTSEDYHRIVFDHYVGNGNEKNGFRQLSLFDGCFIDTDE